jgi:hypothetical protein
MTHKQTLTFFLILLCFPSYGHAQLWSGIIAPARATDWTKAGVKGGIPSANWTQCGSTIAAYTGDASTINNAIGACGTNQYVQLGAGTFTLSTAIWMNKSNVALRGMGADQTFIVGNGVKGCGFGSNAVIQFCINHSSSPSANWTGGYSQGATQVTLSSITGLSIGSVIFLDQLDDSSDGWPSTGDIYVCQAESATCSAAGKGGNGARSGRAETEVHEVTAISGTGPYTVTIAPPISNPNWRSGQSPGASWLSGLSNTIVDAGVENLSVDWTAVQGTQYNSGITISYAKDCWIKGVRVIDTSTSPQTLMNPVFLNGDMRVTMQDSYIYGPYVNPTSVFQIFLVNDGSMLVQNNIVHRGNQPIASGGPLSDSVVAYNYIVGTTNPGPGDFWNHGAGEFLSLWEGNIGKNFVLDAVHGTHTMQTSFRNVLGGASSSLFGRQPFYVESFVRFLNVIGNVLGDSTFSAYESNVAYNENAIYNLGWSAPPGSGEVRVNSDSNVERTLMRWGNWDTVTNATRWCGNSSDTGWSTICGNTSEVPAGIPNFSNPVPSKGDTGAGQSAMPASFYLTSRPSWWPPSKPWPAIGPDVTGGNIADTTGHAYTNPAADCYLSVMGGPADGSGGPLSFNATACYGQSSGPAPPTGLAAVAD